MTVHELKIYPKYYRDVVIGLKTFEYRKNDRYFQVGDILRLCEYCDYTYTGNVVLVSVTYIFDPIDMGYQSDFVVLGIKVIGVVSGFVPTAKA